MPKRPVLVALPYSPWSEKARWALLHHRIHFHEREYLPMLGAPWLRLRTRRWSGRLTVPVLLEHDRVTFDSCAIARRADALGAAPSLFPAHHNGTIEPWVARSEALLEAGRARVVARTLASQDALREAVPAVFPASSRGRLEPLARLGANFLARKYATRAATPHDHLQRMRDVLEELRGALSSPRDFLLDDFTFADIAMAAALQVVVPVAERWIPLGPATRVVWTEPELADEFADLIAWRDRMYEAHRTR